MNGLQRLLDEVDWRPLPEPENTAGLYATHEGTLTIAGLELRCYVLNDGQRVFDAEETMRALGGDVR